MKTKHFIPLVLYFASGAFAVAQNITLSERADQFFQRHEWSSACAAYETLAHQKPGQTKNYVNGITSALMSQNNEKAMQLASLALDHHISLDSLFTGIRNSTISLQENSMYENFLLDMKKNHAWLSRSVNQYLLFYYVFRDNPENIISTAQILLKDSPENITFLEALAQGQLKGGEIDACINTYKKILQLDPRDDQALLYLANYYFAKWEEGEAAVKEEALNYTQRASLIKMTPRLESMLTRLRD